MTISLIVSKSSNICWISAIFTDILKGLSLYNNNLQSIPIQSFVNLVKLEYLSLAENKLQSEIELQIGEKSLLCKNETKLQIWRSP